MNHPDIPQGTGEALWQRKSRAAFAIAERLAPCLGDDWSASLDTGYVVSLCGPDGQDLRFTLYQSTGQWWLYIAAEAPRFDSTYTVTELKTLAPVDFEPARFADFLRRALLDRYERDLEAALDLQRQAEQRKQRLTARAERLVATLGPQWTYVPAWESVVVRHSGTADTTAPPGPVPGIFVLSENDRHYSTNVDLLEPFATFLRERAASAGEGPARG